MEALGALARRPGRLGPTHETSLSMWKDWKDVSAMPLKEGGRRSHDPGRSLPCPMSTKGQSVTDLRAEPSDLEGSR